MNPVARVRPTAILIATTGVMAAAFAAAIASPAYAQAPPCFNTPPPTGGFARCTSSSPDGVWRSLPCVANANYDGTSGPFNIYIANNACGDRVWLHQNANWQTAGGWAVCVSPDVTQLIGTDRLHPMNIYVSNNPARC